MLQRVNLHLVHLDVVGDLLLLLDAVLSEHQLRNDSRYRKGYHKQNDPEKTLVHVKLLR